MSQNTQMALKCKWLSTCEEHPSIEWNETYIYKEVCLIMTVKKFYTYLIVLPLKSTYICLHTTLDYKSTYPTLDFQLYTQSPNGKS